MLRMLITRIGLYTGENFNKLLEKKNKGKFGNLFTIIWWNNDYVPAFLCDHCLHDVHLYIRKKLTNREMVNFQKWDFLCPQRNLRRHIVITLSARPSLRPASCPVHISYIIWGRNPKFSMRMKIGMAKCRVPFLGNFTLPSDLVFKIIVSGANLSYYLRLWTRLF